MQDLTTQLNEANARIKQLTIALEQAKYSNEVHVNELNRMQTALAEYVAQERLLNKTSVVRQGVRGEKTSVEQRKQIISLIQEFNLIVRNSPTSKVGDG